MSKLNTITLLSGTNIVLEKIHTVIVPEVVDFEDGAPVVLENDKHEYIGTAEVTGVKVETFALLQHKDLELTSHPGTTAWQNALHTLVQQVPGFSQLDKVSIVTFYVHATAGTGLTIVATDAEPTEQPPEPDIPPSFEEQYKGLEDLTDIEGNK